MRYLTLTIPQMAFIAATRGAFGLGAGLLLSDRIGGARRKSIGWALVVFGVITTIPIARAALGRSATRILPPAL